MTRFADQYISACVAGYPCVSSPRWSTDLVMVDSGAEVANQRWQNVLHHFRLPQVIREMPTFNAIRDHWLVMRGPFNIWPFRDPLDFASVALEQPNVAPPVTYYDQPLGVGDGLETEFQLVKRYTRGSQTYDRTIELPIVDTVVVQGAQTGSPTAVTLSAWTVSRPSGVVTFADPPPAGTILTAGFLFDVPVRFESDDSFDGIVQALTLAGNADLTFIETRIC